MSSLERTVVPFFWTSTPALSFVSGQALDQSLNQSVTNPQNYPLAYTLIGGALPSGCTLSSNGTVAYNGTGAVTSTSVQFRVASGGFNAESSVGSIQIQVGAQAPVFTLAPATASLPSTGGTIQFTASAATAVTYSLVTTRNGITINSSTGLVTVSSAAQATSGFISVRATASGLSTDVNCSVTVAAYVGSGDWQLAPGHYEASVKPLEIYFPRPGGTTLPTGVGAETNSFARHRRSYPGIPYRIPVCAAWGAAPYYFELLQAPSGATIGSWLTQNGDVLEVGSEYGVIHWQTPVAGSHTFSVRVTDQEGTVQEVSWVCEVTTAGVIFVDPAGSDVTGNGSIGNPFASTRGWYKDNPADTTYAGYHVIYRGGTHAIYFDPNASNPGGGDFDGSKKPFVHYGYHGENVIWDMSSATFQNNGGAIQGSYSSDFYLAHLNIPSFPTRADYKGILVGHYGPNGQDILGGGNRYTLFDLNISNMNPTSSGNNAGFLFGTSTYGNGKRTYYCFSRVTFLNCNCPSPTNFAGMYPGTTDKICAEHINAQNCNFGRAPVETKGWARNICYSYFSNIGPSSTGLEKLSTMHGDTYNPAEHTGPWLVRFATWKGVTTVTTNPTIFVNNTGDIYNEARGDGFAYVQRCTLYAENQYIGRITAAWPTYFRKNVFICNKAEPCFYLGTPNNYPSDADYARRYLTTAGAVDGNLVLTGARTALLGTFGAEIA